MDDYFFSKDCKIKIYQDVLLSFDCGMLYNLHMLIVLPVHFQHRGQIFLPFVDEDPKTAEIISKIILFSEDYKLKDPTILAQIAR